MTGSPGSSSAEPAAPAPISVVTWHEALFGAARLPTRKRKQAVERYLREVVQASFAILPYSQAAAEWHAIERARLEARGRTPPFADGQIAAIARVNGLALVTANVRDFRDFEGLRVENWTARRSAR